MCKKVRDLVYSDRRIQVEEIAQALGISHGSVSTILHDRLGMRKLKAHWVPKSLSEEQMATRASVCSALLKRFRSKDDFLLHLVTVDETWVKGHPGAFREGEVLQQFQDFREKFWSKFWISLYILYIFTSPTAQDREKSASLGRLFLPNHPLVWPLTWVHYYEPENKAQSRQWVGPGSLRPKKFKK